MKIRTRLTLIFTGLTGLLILILSLAIYFFSVLYNQRAFFALLKDRAYIIAQVYLEQDELNSTIYQSVRRQLSRSLPQEEEGIYNLHREPQLLPQMNGWNYPEGIYQKIIDNRYVEFMHGQKQTIGLLYQDNQGDYIIIVSAYDELGNNELANLRKILIAGFLSSIGLMYIMGRFFARHALQPISSVVHQVNEITASNLNSRVGCGNGKDEIAELCQTFNRMLQRLEIAFEMQKTFISNASHELRNPLTAILGEVEITLNKSRNQEEYVQSLQKVSREAERLQSLTTSLLNLSSAYLEHKNLDTERIRADELVWELKSEMDDKIPDNRIVIEFANLPEDSDRLFIQGNKMLLKIALMNILENACKFSGNAKVIMQLDANDREINFRIKDRGIGIPDKEISYILEPFYRCSNARAYKGFGIGLPLSNKIINLNRGKMQIQSQLQKGTEVQIYFPVLQ